MTFPAQKLILKNKKMSKRGYLTSAEYAAIRKTLGFTQQEAAEFHKVQNVRTIKRWENGDSWVSELACEKITQLFKIINTQVREACEIIAADFDSKPKEEWDVAVLIQYPDACYARFVTGIGNLPNSVHKTMVNRIYLSLTEQGYPVGIIMFNPQSYFSFLAANGREDSQESRAIWAAAAYR